MQSNRYAAPPLYPPIDEKRTMTSKDNITLLPPRDGQGLIPNAPPCLVPQQLLLGPDSHMMTCPFCAASIRTAIKYTTTTRTHIAAALCGFICCCCCLPYCMDSAKNSDHYCPSCHKYLGTYEK